MTRRTDGRSDGDGGRATLNPPPLVLTHPTPPLCPVCGLEVPRTHVGPGEPRPHAACARARKLGLDPGGWKALSDLYVDLYRERNELPRSHAVPYTSRDASALARICHSMTVDGRVNLARVERILRNAMIEDRYWSGRRLTLPEIADNMARFDGPTRRALNEGERRADNAQPASEGARVFRLPTPEQRKMAK